MKALVLVLFIVNIHQLPALGQLNVEEIVVMPSFHQNIHIKFQSEKETILIYIENGKSDTIQAKTDSTFSAEFKFWLNNIAANIKSDLIYRDSLVVL